MSLTDLSNECPRSRKILPLAPVLEVMGPKLAFLRSPGLDSASLPRRPRSGPALRLVLGRGANTHAPCAPRNGGPVARSRGHSARAVGSELACQRNVSSNLSHARLAQTSRWRPVGRAPGGSKPPL